MFAACLLFLHPSPGLSCPRQASVYRCVLLHHVRAEVNVTSLGQAAGMVIPAKNPFANTAYSPEANYQQKEASAGKKGIPNEKE